MNKEIKGYCVQKGKPNPNKPVDIETNVIGKNLFEVNGITYTDSLPENFNIGITKEQFCEYDQLKQENKQLKEELEKKHKKYLIDSKCINDKEEVIYMFQSIIKDLEEWLYENESFDDCCNETTFTSVLDKIQELKEKYK